MQLAAPRPVPPLQKLEFESTHPRQAEYNEKIPGRLDAPDDTARERVEDAIQFAIWMKPSQPNAVLSVSPEPVIHLEGEEGGMTFHISLCHGHFGYAVNSSPQITIENVHDRIPIGRKLVTVWENLVRHLPEGFVIYGPDVDPEGENFEGREHVLQWLGFGATEPNGDRFGIVRGGKVTPLTGAEFASLTGGDVADLFKQRFMVEEIIWNTEE